MVRYLLPLAFIVLGVPVVAGGDEQPNSNSPDKPDARVGTPLRKLIDESIHWYQLRKGAKSETVLEPLIVMRWPNNIRGSTDGASVIWVADGRPEAIGSIYPWQEKFVHEFESLSRGSLEAEFEERLVWKPETAGLEFREIPDAPPPSQSAPLRLRQMKALASQFSSTLLGWRDDGSQVEKLRLILRPLYRYEIKRPDQILDGALFAYAVGTDPETLLVIEAVRRANQWRWEYAFVRQTSAGLEGRFRDQLVWTAQKYPPNKVIGNPHIQFTQPLADVLPAEN